MDDERFTRTVQYPTASATRWTRLYLTHILTFIACAVPGVTLCFDTVHMKGRLYRPASAAQVLQLRAESCNRNQYTIITHDLPTPNSTPLSSLATLSRPE
jgi:hypothetical protein